MNPDFQLINFSEFQRQELENLHPKKHIDSSSIIEGLKDIDLSKIKLPELQQIIEQIVELLPLKAKVANYCAFISEDTYERWKIGFQALNEKMISHFHVDSQVEINCFTSLPLFQWKAKLTVSKKELVTPKAFKVGILPEGTFKNFGYSIFLTQMLNSFHSFYPNFKFRSWDYLLDKFYYPDQFLGFCAWNNEDNSDKMGDRWLPCFLANCARTTDSIKVTMDESGRNPKIVYNGKSFGRYSFVTTHNYYSDSAFYQQLLKDLNHHSLLAVPLNWGPTRIENFKGLSDEFFAELYPYGEASEVIKEQAKRSGSYVLLRTDNNDIYPWSRVENDPILKLSLTDMEENWCWQEACPTPYDINLYWTPAIEYPWLVEKSTGNWIPAFIWK